MLDLIVLRAVGRELTLMASFCARSSLTAADMWEPNTEKTPAVKKKARTWYVILEEVKVKMSESVMPQKSRSKALN